MTDETLHDTKHDEYCGSPNAVIAWAMDTFNLTYGGLTASAPVATIENIVVVRDKGDSYQISIYAIYEGTGQMYRGVCWGVDVPAKPKIDALQAQIDALREEMVTEKYLENRLADLEFIGREEIELMISGSTDEFINLSDLASRVREVVADLISDDELTVVTRSHLELS
jgi:hypothetical protein